MLIRSIISGLKLKNAVLVNPGDDLAAKYAWLKSSDRDAVMGALSATNHRTIVLAPGTHTLTATLTLDTSYVDIVSLSGNPKDTFVLGDLASTPIITQTANVITLIGFTVQNNSTNASCKGFYQDATDNSNSLYRYMEFYCPNQGTSYPCNAESNEYGTWEYCIGGDNAWRMTNAGTWGPTMLYCTAGEGAYAGDVVSGVLAGAYLDHCVGGIESFGGCGGRGLVIQSTCIFIDCVASHKSYAMDVECAGTFIRCTGGNSCFGGWLGSGTNYGKFTGYARDCIAGRGSFGMGTVTAPHTKSYLSGRIENCVLGSRSQYATGALEEWGTEEIYDQSAAASVTTALAGDNNDLVFTFKNKGIFGNEYQILYQQYGTGKPIGGVIITRESIDKLQIKVNINAEVTTATVLKGYVDADADTMYLLTVTNAGGNDGSGTVPLMSAVDFTGGVDKPHFRNNHPYAPTACTVAKSIRAFDNGHTYTNEGATGSVEFTLPPALKGFKYTIVKIAQQNILITPAGSDTIDGLSDLDNTAAESDKFCKVECFEDGNWLSTVTGTWA